MTPILTTITSTISPAILAAMPVDCDGQEWSVKNEGVCTYIQRPDEKQRYLFGPIWPTDSSRNFVTLDDAYDVQFAFVPSDVLTPDFAVLAGARRKTNIYNVQLVIATWLRIPHALDRIEYALNDCHGVTIQGINYDTLRNVQLFLQPNANERGLNPERLVAVVSFQNIINFSHELSDL